MNILVIGLGSIGKRHLKNILSLGYKNISIVSASANTSDEYKNLCVFKTIEEAFSSNHFDAAFVCSPTAFHIDQLTTLLERKVKAVYIEKPLSNSLEYVENVIKLANEYSSNIV